MIERQVGQLVRLVDDLIDVSRITRGQIELRKETIDLPRSSCNPSKPAVRWRKPRITSWTVSLWPRADPAVWPIRCA